MPGERLDGAGANREPGVLGRRIVHPGCVRAEVAPFPPEYAASLRRDRARLPERRPHQGTPVVAQFMAPGGAPRLSRRAPLAIKHAGDLPQMLTGMIKVHQFAARAKVLRRQGPNPPRAIPE